MADAASKFTVFLEGIGGGFALGSGGNTPTGWTETYYSPAGLSQAALAAFVQQYVPARAALLGLGAQINYVRQASVNNPAQKRLTHVQFMFGKQGLPSIFTNPPTDDYDPSWVDLLCRVEDSLGHRRQLWIGGLPESQADQLQEQGIKAAYVNSPAFKQWVQAVLGLQLGIRYGVVGGVGTFGAIAVIQPEDVRRRNRGRPFRLERGRRLA